MCGRYAITSAPEAMRRLFKTTNPLPNFQASFNVAPTQNVIAVRFNPETRERHLDVLRWGLVPIWAKDQSIGSKLINARCETVTTKPAFRDAFRKRRCLIPADVFYEWKGKPGAKQPYAIARVDGEPMAFAGLWERWKSLEGEVVRSCTIVTTDANQKVAELHDRMPVILGADDWSRWLGEDDGDPESLMRPCPDEWLKTWPVSKAVNSVKNDDASLIESVATSHVSAGSSSS